MDSLADIEQRAQGQFHLSIATSLAMEGACGVLEDGPRYPKPPLTRYDELWVNIRTLFRNVHGAVDKDTAALLTPKEYHEAILAEMQVFPVILGQYHPKCKVVFYACDFRTLVAEFPKAMLKADRTDRQKQYTAIETKTIELLFPSARLLGFDVRHFSVSLLPTGTPKVLLISHHPIDLLSKPNFSTLDLLESHTGVIKKPPLWNTKLHNGKELDRIPFNKMTIQMFGDHGGMFSPYPIAYRKEILAIAAKDQWTTVTTKERILLTVKHHRNASLEIVVRDLFH